MTNKNILKLKETKYNKIFIVEDRNFWPICSNSCNKETDLILCVDFALKQKLSEEGYCVEFLDHLAESLTLERLNKEMHNFMNNWYKDNSELDLLEYKGYHLGDSLLLFLVSDITHFCHYFFNIISLETIKHEYIYVATDDEIIIDCLDKSGLVYTKIKEEIECSSPIYLFPIIKWVNEKTKPSLSFKVKNVVANVFDFYFKVIDFLRIKKKAAVYIQKYHPTEQIIQYLQCEKLLQIFLPNYTGLTQLGKNRRIHYSDGLVSSEVAHKMIERFRKNRVKVWKVFHYSMSTYIYEIIDKVLEEHLLKAMNNAESIEKSLKTVDLKLMIPITNLWTTNRLVMQYCFKNNIPVFTIINGQLNTSYYHDAKDSNYVNSYSVSIKKNYFENKNNAFPLGDPRMDKYSKISNKEINRNLPTIIIGAAGYDSIDLNSYLSYEFDFLYDILFCISQGIKKGCNANVILKVRGNGYINLYTNFIKEYFNHLGVSIFQDKSFFKIITDADLYISIFSQTIFEASCLGIPTIYYKKDTQFIHEPFDGKSELVTANNITELQEKIDLFYKGSDVYDAFMERSVLEKYIGPLDGKNTKRNIDFIMDLIADKHR